MKTMRILLLGGSGGIGSAIYNSLLSDFYIEMPSSKELDLSDLDSIKNYFQFRQAKYDFIIYAAGVNVLKSVDEVSEEDVEWANKVNFLGLLTLTKFNLEYWKEKKSGGVVAIGSLFSSSAKANRLSYVVSKHGLYGLIKSLSVELANYNILVNLISPGYIDTELTQKNNSKEKIIMIENQIPLKRLGEPKEIAQLVSYFVNENTYITGQNIIIDGGISIDFTS
jgi:3-oxoacyl-[acyl-carrier protein] reductase